MGLTAPQGEVAVFKFLQKGTWTRPSDKMAVYTEIPPGSKWGIRVTLFGDWARVEAIDDLNCSWYKPPKKLSVDVHPPRFWERLRGVTFESSLKEAVEEKRRLAARKNNQP